MFPGPGAQIIRNEAGEVLGWDYPSFDPPEFDDYETILDWEDEDLRDYDEEAENRRLMNEGD